MKQSLIKTYLSILITTIALFLLTGCYNSTELDDLAYVIGIAIDKGEEKKFLITLQVAVPTKIASEGSEPGKDSSTLITTESDSLSSAISYASSRTSKEIRLSHNKIIVFSEEIAKTELTNCVNAFISSQEIRPRTAIIVCPDKARSFLENAFPVLETNPARYYDLLLDSAEYAGYTIKTELIDFYLNNKSKYINPITIHGNITTYENGTSSVVPDLPSNNNSSSDSEKNSNSTSSNSDTNSSNENSSNSGKSGSNQQGEDSKQNQEDLTPKLYGIAVFANNVMVGKLTGYETVAHSIMVNSLQVINFDIGKTTLAISQRKNPKIKVKLNNNTPIIDIEILLDAKLLYSGDNLDYSKEENKRRLANKIEKEFKNIINNYLEKTSKEFKSDIVGFGKIFKGNYLTNKELEKVEWLKLYENSIFNLEVKVNLDSAQIFSSTESAISK